MWSGGPDAGTSFTWTLHPPGLSREVRLMTTATFTGTSPLTYTQYLAMDSGGHTLAAVPGDTYDVAIADQWQGLAGLPDDGNWVQATRGLISFTSTPGFAIPGGATGGEPGLVRGVAAVGPHEVAAPDVVTAPERGPRVITGKRRAPRAAPPRRRPRRILAAGVRRGR